MISRILEAIFRHPFLVLLPPLLIPLIVGPIALALTPPYYESWAGIWVDRPTYLTYNDGWNQYITPAQNQFGRLDELLRTRAFQIDVAKRTSLAPLVGSQRGEQQIQKIISQGLAAQLNGSNLLVIRFRSPNAQLSQQVLSAVIDAFKDKTATDRVDQASIAVSFYQSRLQDAEKSLAKANDAVRSYVAANPRLLSLGADGGAGATAAARLGLPATAIDPTLGDLLRQVDLQQQDVERLRTSLETARLDASAALEGQELGFQVVDPPQLPTDLIRSRRKILIYPVAGLVVGLGISAALVIVLVAGDRSIRSEAELPAGLRVIGLVPQLQPAGVAKRTGPEVTRRAIGFAAGAAVPLLPAPQRG